MKFDPTGVRTNYLFFANQIDISEDRVFNHFETMPDSKDLAAGYCVFENEFLSYFFFYTDSSTGEGFNTLNWLEEIIESSSKTRVFQSMAVNKQVDLQNFDEIAGFFHEKY